MGAELSSTVGIVALAAAALALVARRASCVVLFASCAGCAPTSAPCSASSRSRTSSRTPPRSTPSFRDAARLRPRRGRAARRAPDGVAEERLDGAIAHCGLIRYDAYNEMSGRQSTSIALLDSRRSGVVLSSIHHRDQARLYAKQISEGKRRAASSRPRRRKRSASRCRGPSGRTLMRLGYLGPAGHVLRGGGALGRRTRDGAELVALRDRPRHGHGRPRRRPSTARSCRSRTRSRARSASRSTRSPTDARRDDRRRARARRLAVPHRRASRSTLDGDRARRLAPAAARAVRALPARAPAAPPTSCRPRRPPRPCASSSPRPAPWAALGTRRAAELYGATVLADGVEDEPGNATRFVWLARDGARARRAGAPAKTSLAFWGAGDDSPGWLVRCLSEFAFRGVNLTKIESRPLRARLGHYRFFVDCEGDARRRAGRRRGRRPARALRAGAGARLVPGRAPDSRSRSMTCRADYTAAQSWRLSPRHQAQRGSRRIRSTGGADVSVAVCSS